MTLDQKTDYALDILAELQARTDGNPEEAWGVLMTALQLFHASAPPEYVMALYNETEEWIRRDKKEAGQ